MKCDFFYDFKTTYTMYEYMQQFPYTELTFFDNNHPQNITTPGWGICFKTVVQFIGRLNCTKTVVWKGLVFMAQTFSHLYTKVYSVKDI